MSDRPPVGAAGPIDDAATSELPAWQRRLLADRTAMIPLIPSGRAVAPARPDSSLADLPAKSGILVIDKPKGMTSHDVVQAIRRASGERRVGHAGTLDPLATGVLVVCIGSATRVVEEIQDLPKVYGAELCLGVETDSYDAEGKVLARRDPSRVDRASIERAVAAYHGWIDQVPPMHSALHHEGRRLYELAREGREVERPPRRVRVDRMELRALELPYLHLEMEVSKGFYVRSLAHDLGRDLACGAHLSGLVRLGVGPFVLDEAEPLSRAVEAFVGGWWPLVLHPLDAALVQLPAMVVDADGERDLRHGKQLRPAGDPALSPAASARVYGAEGRFVGLVTWDDVTGAWQPAKVFPAAGVAPKAGPEA